MSDRIMNVTAAAAWVLAFCVMAFAVIFVMISKVSADALGECPPVFTTQDICVITTTETSIAPRTKDADPPEERYVGTPYHVNGKLHIRPVDGCGNHVDGRKTNCHEPIVFTVNGTEYCIQDNQAHGDQLCATESPQQQDAPQTQGTPPQQSNDPPEQTVSNSEPTATTQEPKTVLQQVIDQFMAIIDSLLEQIAYLRAQLGQ